MTSIRLTPSLLDTWGRCPKQAEYAHLLKLRVPPGIAAPFGTQIHRQILDVDQASRIAGSGYRDIGELKEGFVAGFRVGVLEVETDSEEIQEAGGIVKVANDYEALGLSLLDEYNKRRARFEGRAVEHAFNIPFGDGTMEGRFDIVKDDTATRDIKTCDIRRPKARKWTEQRVAASTQFAAYAAANARLTGQTEQTIGAEVGYMGRSGTPWEGYVAQRGAAAHEATEAYAAEVQKSIAAGAFPPVSKASLDAWVCSAKFCGYWSDPMPNGQRGCPWGQRASVAVSLGSGLPTVNTEDTLQP